MKDYEKVFFSLLRKAMWGTPVEVPEGFDEWDKVVKLAKTQSVLGVVGDAMVSDEGVSSCLDAGQKAGIRNFIMSNLMAHGKLNGVLSMIVARLREEGVESVLLKGQGLARYYPKPELRQCGDIDLYVGQENYAKAYDVFKPMASEIDDRKAMDVGKHYHVSFGRIMVEVHRYCNEYPSKKLDAVFQAASKEGLGRDTVAFDFDGVRVDTPADTFNAFYVFDHLFHHFLTSGIGFRQICDWMRFLHVKGSSVNQAKLKQLLEDMDLMKPWKAFGCLLSDVLGMPSEEFPFYDPSYSGKVAPVVRRILEEGNFGKERDVFKKRGKIYLLNKTRSFLAHIGRSFRLFMLFPSQAFSWFMHTMESGFAAVWNDARIRFGKKSD